VVSALVREVFSAEPDYPVRQTIPISLRPTILVQGTPAAGVSLMMTEPKHIIRHSSSNTENTIIIYMHDQRLMVGFQGESGSCLNLFRTWTRHRKCSNSSYTQEPPLSPRRRATRVSRHELTLNHGTSDSRVLSLCFGDGGGTVRADNITYKLPPLALTNESVSLCIHSASRSNAPLLH